MDYLTFIIFGILFVSCESENRNLYGPKCLSCKGARDPAECTSATTCWASQKCYAERYMHADGHVLYDFGCRIKEECEFLSGSRDRRVDITIDLCEECCEGEFCNVNTCVNRTESSETACYACEYKDSPNDCHKLERCGPGEICYAEKVISDSPDPRYTLGCLAQQVCSFLNNAPQPIGKRSTHLCQKCCSTSGCNMDVCGDDQSQQTTHMVTQERTTTRFTDEKTTGFRTTPYTVKSTYPTAVTTIQSTTPFIHSVRLVNGLSNFQGRVEIFYNGRWGTICDDGFDGTEEVGVVCHMLGFSRMGSRVWKSAHFGQGHGQIWLDDLNCHGNETDILQCDHRQPIGANNCGHNEDVGVTCAFPKCPTDFVAHNDSCYLFDTNTTVKSYLQAEAECSKHHATLVDVETLEERDFISGVVKTITDSTGEWLTGAKYLNSRWVLRHLHTPISSDVTHGLQEGPCLSFEKDRINAWLDVNCDGFPRNYICETNLA